MLSQKFVFPRSKNFTSDEGVRTTPAVPIDPAGLRAIETTNSHKSPQLKLLLLGLKTNKMNRENRSLVIPCFIIQGERLLWTH